MYKLLLIIFTLLAFMFSCGKTETEEPIDMGYDYFPLEVSSYSIYKVDSIAWDDFNSSLDTFSYLVKLVVDSQYIDNAGRNSNWLRKYIQKDTTSFIFNTNNSITKTSGRLEIMVEDKKYIKLVFPFSAGTSWNSNALNNDEATNAICTNFDYSTTVLGKSYEQCANISYEDNINLVQEFVHEEIYARDYGMIYKKHIHKELKQTGMRGFNVVYKLMENGKK